MAREFTSLADPVPHGGKLFLGDVSAETPASGTPDAGAELTPAVSFPSDAWDAALHGPAERVAPSEAADRQRPRSL